LKYQQQRGSSCNVWGRKEKKKKKKSSPTTIGGGMAKAGVGFSPGQDFINIF
jgi:hypothetical protein